MNQTGMGADPRKDEINQELRFAIDRGLPDKDDEIFSLTLLKRVR